MIEVRKHPGSEKTEVPEALNAKIEMDTLKVLEIRNKPEAVKEPKVIKLALSFSEAFLTVTPVGEDIHILFSGGDRPHIGCTMMAVPRESLTGDGSISVTSSVMNLTGHKDEAVCRELAEAWCRKTGRVTVCTGGFHVDNITAEQIAELMEEIRKIICR